MKLENGDIVFKNLKPFGYLAGIVFSDKILINICGITTIIPKFLLTGSVAYRLSTKHPDMVSTLNYLLGDEFKKRKLINIFGIKSLFQFKLGLSGGFIAKIFKVVGIEFDGGKLYVYPSDLEFDKRFERIS